MSDDTTTFRHWTIKDFPVSTRERMLAAAQAEKKTLAQWLEPVIDAALDAELGQVNRVSNRSNLFDPIPHDVDDLCRLVRVASEFAAQRKHMQRDLAAVISRRLKQALLVGQTGLTTGKTQPKPLSDTASKQPELLQSPSDEAHTINGLARYP